MGRVAEARSLILDGHVEQGLRLLNEAGVAAVSGELEPLFTGIVDCELVCALQALGLYDLAEQWTAAMEHWRHGQPVGSVHGRCRVPQGGDPAPPRCLGRGRAGGGPRLRGACDPYLRREFGWPLTELWSYPRSQRGRHRRGRGGASSPPHEGGWEAQPGLALVRLAQGDAQSACAARSATLSSTRRTCPRRSCLPTRRCGAHRSSPLRWRSSWPWGTSPERRTRLAKLAGCRRDLR